MSLCKSYVSRIDVMTSIVLHVDSIYIDRLYKPTNYSYSAVKAKKSIFTFKEIRQFKGTRQLYFSHLDYIVRGKAILLIKYHPNKTLIKLLSTFDNIILANISAKS